MIQMPAPKFNRLEFTNLAEKIAFQREPPSALLQLIAKLLQNLSSCGPIENKLGNGFVYQGNCYRKFESSAIACVL